MARQVDVDRHGQACPTCGGVGCAERHRVPPPPPPSALTAGAWEQRNLDLDQEVEEW